jgi:cytochrome P450
VSNTIEGFETIYGTSSKSGGVFEKASWYTYVSGYPDLFSDRDPGHHAQTRKLFSESFTPKSIGGHEGTMSKHADKLMRVVSRSQGTILKLHDSFRRYATDLMFDIIIGKQLDCLEGEDHVDFVSHVPSNFYWAVVRDHLCCPLGLLFGAILKTCFHKEIMAQKKEAADIIKERLHGMHERRDIMAEVLSRPNVLERDDKDLFLNFRAVLSASIHTTSTALSSTTYFILTTPSVRDNLVKELRGAFPDTNEISGDTLTRLPYLNAVVSESLRLYPPVPVLGGRISPGTKVDGVEIPRGVSC